MNAETLTLRQKIGQMAVCSLDGGAIDVKTAALLRDYCVGNIIHFGNNVSDFAQASALNAELTTCIKENCAGIPPLLSVDHEGGRVMRFSGGFTWFPSQMALGAADDEELTQAVGRAMGEELRAAGFNLSFSPVLDMLPPGKPGFIGIRSFGSDPEAVVRHGAAMAKGLESAGIMACAKHFPGHGDTETDSHYGLPVVDKPRDALEAMELLPYRRVIGENAANAVMTTHILFPALEEKEIPATMSRKILTGLLRGEMGFGGLIVTDGMQMAAIARHYGIERGCIEAVKAGADLLCVGTGGAGSGDVQASCLEAVHQAVVSGEIPMKRIDEAVNRILRLKEKYCEAESPDVMPDMPDMPDFQGHERLNKLVCRKSVTFLHGILGENVLRGRVLCASTPVRELAFGLGHADPRSRSFAEMAGEVLGMPHIILNGSPMPEDYDTLLLGVTVLQADSPELAIARNAMHAGKRVAFVHIGSPAGKEPWPQTILAVGIYCLTPVSVRAALDTLTGKESATGTLPTA